MIIALEGINGSGKSTVLNLIQSNNSDEITVCHNPDDTKVSGVLAKTYLNHPEITINPFISYTVATLSLLGMQENLNWWYTLGYQNDGVYLWSRSPWSSLIYGTLYSNIYYEDLLNLVIGSIALPDLVIYYDIDCEVAYDRIQKRNNQIESYQTLDDLIKIKEAYSKKLDVINSHSYYPLVTLDTTHLSTEEVYSHTLAVINGYKYDYYK